MKNGNFIESHHAARAARVLLVLGLAFIAGCTSVLPVPEMVIYKSGLNQVYLVKDPDSASNAHPTTLSQSEVGALLRGIRVWKQRNLIHQLYAGEAERTRGFRNEEVKVLAPALSNALQLASSDQRVYFHLSHATDYGEEETTSGWLYVRDNLLYISLSEIHDRHSPGPDISKYDRQMPNVPEQAPAFHVTFEPEEYLHTVRSGWRVFTVDQREELQVRYREALDALTKSPKP
ncbi:MAG: hypothetical protein HP491_18670 [Nitrospira sp.]|nr:hypothetical protein [Nitrospira sp.]MBH0183636.1 hypothetical protein [Nitrospira sp.]